MGGLPTWVLVLLGAVVVYLLYRYWEYKQSTKYSTGTTFLDSLNFSSLRDNPSKGDGKG